MGRPSLYNEKLAKEICLRLVHGEGIREICRDKHIPDVSTVLRWALDAEHPFYGQYARARREQAEGYADQVRRIADDPNIDVQRARLMVDTRKWIACKLLPKVYGDKLDVTTDGAPINFTLKLGDANGDGGEAS